MNLFQWEQRESNPRPSACKADALNQLSYAPETGLQIYEQFLYMQVYFQKKLQSYDISAECGSLFPMCDDDHCAAFRMLGKTFE